MKVQKRLPTTLTILIYLVSVAVLAMSPVSAADTATAVTMGTGAGHWPGHHGAFNGTVNGTLQAERFQSLITKLGQQGADISRVQADLTAGNTTAVMQWFQQYRKDHPSAAVNAAGTRTGTGSSGSFSGFFPGHRVNAGNRTAMNRTAGHHAWGTAS